MYLKLFKNFTYSAVFQSRASSPLWRKQTKRWSPLKLAFVTWTFHLPPVFFKTFFSLHLYILRFFSSLKLQYCQTIVFLNKLKLFEETSFQKRRWSCDFPPRKMLVAQKRRAISCQEKMAFFNPPPLRRVVLGLPSPSPRVCTGGRTDGRMLTSQPKCLRSIGYQICLALELRQQALPTSPL